MDVELLRTYCLSKPLSTEDCAFGPEWILFRIYNKIFACLDLTRPTLTVLKCAPDYAEELREKYHGVRPAWHWNKKYWNEVLFDSDVSDELVKKLVDHSLEEVLKKLPRKTREEYARILAATA